MIPGRYLRTGRALHSLAMNLARERRARPQDDLTTRLVSANVDGEHLTDQELGSFFILLLVAGSETTRNALAHEPDRLLSTLINGVKHLPCRT